jgi:hypothetical protein
VKVLDGLSVPYFTKCGRAHVASARNSLTARVIMPGENGSSRPQSRRYDWKELLAAAGVILSLLFVGLELRQNTAAVRATALNDLATGTRELLLTVSADGELSDLYRRWIEDDSAFTATEKARIRLLLAAMLRGAENAYLQARIGVVDSVALRGYGLMNNPAFESPGFSDVWRGGMRDRFHPEFVDALEELYALDGQR